MCCHPKLPLDITHLIYKFNLQVSLYIFKSVNSVQPKTKTTLEYKEVMQPCFERIRKNSEQC